MTAGGQRKEECKKGGKRKGYKRYVRRIGVESKAEKGKASDGQRKKMIVIE